MRVDDVPLQDVVSGIARALGIRLESKVELTDPVTFDRTGTPEQVFKMLLKDRNLVLDSNPVANCGGRETLTTIWLLPAGQAAPARPPAAPVLQQPGEVEFRPLENQMPGQFRKRIGREVSSEEWRQITRDYQDGKLKIDPVTGKLVPVTPSGPKDAGR